MYIHIRNQEIEFCVFVVVFGGVGGGGGGRGERGGRGASPIYNTASEPFVELCFEGGK